MKKLLVFTMIIMMCISFCACINSPAPTEPETTAHTLPPTETIVQVEPEWAEVNCDIKLTDTDEKAVLSSEDFTTFAVVGTNDDDSYIKVKLTQDASDIIKSGNTSDYVININNTYRSSVSIDPADFDGEIEFGSAWTYSELCSIASSIRGLY